MVDFTFEHDEWILNWDRRHAYYFTDDRGVRAKISELGFYDPQTLKDFGLTTVNEVIDWWFSNRSDLIRKRFYQDYWRSGFYYWLDGCVDSMYTRNDIVSMLRLDGDEYPFSFVTSDSVFNSDLFDSSPQQGKPQFNYRGMMYRGRLKVLLVDDSQRFESDCPYHWTKHREYSYKMSETDHNFFRREKRDAPDTVMFGLELEISTSLSTHDIQRIVCDVEPKQEPFFICKKDSSISGRFDNAIELVTVPATPRYLKKAWGLFFKKLDRLARAKGKMIDDYVDTSDNLSNGLHIHVSKNAFKRYHQTRFMAVWQASDSKTRALLQELSGRPTRYTDNGYCQPDYAFEGVTLARKLKGSVTSRGRSVCHTGNSQTVEVRIFQGIFDLPHVLRCIETVEGVYNFTEMLSYSSFGLRLSTRLKEFFLKSSGYRHVKEIFKCA